MGLDEVGTGLLRVFELTDLSGKTGPLAFEKPSVRFGRALPGTLGRLQPGGTGLEDIAGSGVGRGVHGGAAAASRP
jgi:hypothetical protein